MLADGPKVAGQGDDTAVTVVTVVLDVLNLGDLNSEVGQCWPVHSGLQGCFEILLNSFRDE